MLLLLALACDADPISTDASTCALDAPSLSVTSAAPGDQVVLTTHPLTEVWDTAVTVGAARAQVLDLDRSTCTDCDDCRDTGGCSACGDCESCDAACETCVETLTFVVPDVTAGDWPVEVVNRFGRSRAATLTVVAATTP